MSSIVVNGRKLQKGIEPGEDFAIKGSLAAPVDKESASIIAFDELETTLRRAKEAQAPYASFA